MHIAVNYLLLIQDRDTDSKLFCTVKMVQLGELTNPPHQLKKILMHCWCTLRMKRLMWRSFLWVYLF